MIIQINLPKDVSDFVKIEKVKRNIVNQAETIIEILKEAQNENKNESNR